MSRTAKALCSIGSILLLAMAIFHGSGYTMVRDAIAESNASSFLKQIVPALFAHASVHLVGLAAFGILALFLVHSARRLIAVLAAAVIADAILAFYLGGVFAGAALMAAALCFVLAAAQPLRVSAQLRGNRPLFVS